MDRRFFLGLLGSGAASAILARHALAWPWDKKEGGAKKEEFAYTMSDAQWKEKLSPEAYHVLREEGTERAFTSPLNDEHRKGVFVCAGCGWELYSSAQKFNSGTGWPSFWQPINDQAVGTSGNDKFGMGRTEVHCAHCGGHLGHVFPDGPPPTGQRYCMNGVAMAFKPAE
jgi:peptide-methionine (R)-S-oxide reductase